MLMLLAGALIALSGCGFIVDESEAVRAAETMGMRGVRVTGRHDLAPKLYGCGKGDAVGFDVQATNVAGRRVEATVCCGALFKGCTVRSK